jgi:tetratricopeptide (TPR) repeat protein
MLRFMQLDAVSESAGIRVGLPGSQTGWARQALMKMPGQQEWKMNQNSTIETYHCVRCGRESTVKEAFVFSKGSLFKKESITCFECHNKKQAASMAANFLILLVGGLLLSMVAPGGWLGIFYLQVSVGMLFFLPLIVLHELSHALVARVLRFHVFPIGGITLVAGPKLPAYRWRIFLIHLAGPALHFLLILLSLWLLPAFQGRGLLHELILIQLWLNVFILLTNLYPRKASTTAGLAGTDGWAMLNIFRISPEDLDKRYANNKAAAKRWLEQGLALYPQSAFMVNAAGYAYSNFGEHQKARDEFVRVLEMGGELGRGFRYLVLNNIAYSDILLDDPNLLAEADQYSAEAYKNLPWEAVIGGTRGAVLIFLGQVDEGLGLLKTSMTNALNPREKASTACMIAIGEHKRGDSSAAQKYLTAARQLDPECALLERASRALEPAVP